MSLCRNLCFMSLNVQGQNKIRWSELLCMSLKMMMMMCGPLKPHTGVTLTLVLSDLFDCIQVRLQA